jgi:hypothetical protein
MKYKSSLVIGTCIASLMLLASSVVRAESKATPSPAASTAGSTATTEKAATKKMNRAVPFRGKIASVDATAKTFSLAGKDSTRVIKITDQTRIMKQGAEATMSDLSADAEVRGSYWKKEDGSLEARNVKIGPFDATARRAARKQKTTEAAAETSPAASPSATAKP